MGPAKVASQPWGQTPTAGTAIRIIGTLVGSHQCTTTGGRAEGRRTTGKLQAIRTRGQVLLFTHPEPGRDPDGHGHGRVRQLPHLSGAETAVVLGHAQNGSDRRSPQSLRRVKMAVPT